MSVIRALALHSQDKNCWTMTLSCKHRRSWLSTADLTAAVGVGRSAVNRVGNGAKRQTPCRPHLTEGQLDVAGARRKVNDEVVQLAPLRRRQQLVDHACIRETGVSVSTAQGQRQLQRRVLKGGIAAHAAAMHAGWTPSPCLSAKPRPGEVAAVVSCTGCCLCVWQMVGVEVRVRARARAGNLCPT
jgi:hypothetical protein